MKLLNFQSLIYLLIILISLGCKEEEEFIIDSPDAQITNEIIKSINIENDQKNISIHQNLNIELKINEEEEFIIDNNLVYYRVAFMNLKSGNKFRRLSLKEAKNGNTIFINFEKNTKKPLQHNSAYNFNIVFKIFNAKTNKEIKEISKEINFKTYEKNKFYEDVTYKNVTLVDQDDNTSLKYLDKYLIPIIESEIVLNTNIEHSNNFNYKYIVDTVTILDENNNTLNFDTAIIKNKAIALYLKNDFLFEENKTYKVEIKVTPYEYVNNQWKSILTDDKVTRWKFNFKPQPGLSDINDYINIEPTSNDIIPINQSVFLKLNGIYRSLNYLTIVPSVKELRISSGNKTDISVDLTEKDKEYLKISPLENYQENSTVEYNFKTAFKYKVGGQEIIKDIAEIPGNNLVFNTGNRVISIMDTTDIKKSYPLIRQKNYFKEDSNQGFIELNGTNNEIEQIINESSEYSIHFVSESHSLSKTVDFNKDELKFNFEIPNEALKNEEIYTIQLFADNTLLYEEFFRVSLHNSFLNKFNNMNIFQYGARVPIRPGVHSIRKIYITTNEGYDENEFKNISLIGLTEKTRWIEERCKPLFYDLLKYNEFSIDNRDTTIYGVPPRKAINYFFTYNNLSENEIVSNKIEVLEDRYKLFHVRINYADIAITDYGTLRNQAANCDNCIDDMEKVNNLVGSFWPQVWKGFYPFKFTYRSAINNEIISSGESFIYNPVGYDPDN